MLGALLTFAPAPWYPAYTRTAAWWGLGALEDQQLGGLIMWIPAGTVYLGAALLLVTAWLHAVERDVQRREVRPRDGGAATVPQETSAERVPR